MKKIIILAAISCLCSCYEVTLQVVDREFINSVEILTFENGGKIVAEHEYRTLRSHLSHKYYNTFANLTVGDSVKFKSSIIRSKKCIRYRGTTTYPKEQIMAIESIKNIDGGLLFTFNTRARASLVGDNMICYLPNGSPFRDQKLDIMKKTLWSSAKIGQYVKLDYTSPQPYILLMPDDYLKERVVKKVSKYDGTTSKTEGSITWKGRFLGSSSGSGNIAGEEIGSRDFFINIYFEEGKPISVNAKENPLWLDIEKGDIVIESMKQGILYYAPKF